MTWDRVLRDRQEKQERQKQEAECSERYKQFSRDELLRKRVEVEGTLESLKRDFPDWEIQMQSRAYIKILQLEKERECIILEIHKRSESHASGVVDAGAKQKVMAHESVLALPPEQKQVRKVERGKFCAQAIDEIKRIKNLAVGTGRSMAEIEKDYPQLAVWTIRANLASEDQETFSHPTKWGPPVGYAEMVLSKIHGVSKHTINSWVKAYRKSQKNKKLDPS